MSKIDKILSEVYKNEVKLESQEVQLMFKSISDLKKMYETISVAKDKMGDVRRALSQAVTSINTNGKSLNVRANAFIKDAEKTFAEAKVLGLDVPKDVQLLLSLAKDFPKQVEKYFKIANQIESAIKSL